MNIIKMVLRLPKIFLLEIKYKIADQLHIKNFSIMKILVLNCGSSSIKYQLFDMASGVVLAKGIVEKIGLKG